MYVLISLISLSIVFFYRFFFFFFKHKTAYVLRISDWSSDVCSSDLPAAGPRLRRRRGTPGGAVRAQRLRSRGRHALRGVHLGHLRRVPLGRSEERSVGKECVSTGRSRGSPSH